MAVWLPAANRFYLPPQPITRVKNTDEFVSRTSIFYHAATERLLTVGHPYYEIKGANGNVTVPKVSGNQFRVFRVKFPDPNNFAFGDKDIFDPEKERLVWALRGLEIDRGQPLGIALSGNPFFNKFTDAENSFVYDNSQGTDQDKRQNMAFDVKQIQLFMVGCKPQTGEYWDKAPSCDSAPLQAGDCPPIQLVNKIIEDGDMAAVGMGNLNFSALQESKADAPLDLVNTFSIYPDFLRMVEEPFGHSLFFFSRREQMYARHMFNRDGLVGEAIPEDMYLKKDDRNPTSDNYSFSPSGSLVTSEAQLFNRPYWLQKAQGQNNGIIWRNDLFLTVADNTRGTIFSISQSTEALQTWDPTKIKSYMRHVEEYQLSFVLQLCKVKLTPENLAFIHSMDPDIVEDWHLTVNNPPSTVIEDHYRYINSLATKCPDSVVPQEKPDPYKDYKFWEIDMSDRLTEQLDQTPLGRKFLFQTGYQQVDTGKSIVSNPRIRNVRTSRRAPKRKRTTSRST
ncbi:putative late L1 protein [Eptesicus serotinus papillomavirus 1]|uniref:Major capsid protein L1 n=1 Tax=Eptesicus serotinus papillomavirus 1 TaxID=1464071 RepID=W8EFZ5_9PAPI|nr:putative late L1 protein [Eptesicus serotinus papillomavirus 1]AHJ81389.1 putative late L1 protein [Eptesicus serotinus papillomavirus 1]